eukprot:jgi/Botrbrau1/23394/Bobra.0051s0040.1
MVLGPRQDDPTFFSLFFFPKMTTLVTSVLPHYVPVLPVVIIDYDFGQRLQHTIVFSVYGGAAKLGSLRQNAFGSLQLHSGGLSGRHALKDAPW